MIAFDALIQPNGMLVVEGLDFVGDLGTPIICRFDTPGHLDSAGFGAPSTPGCVAFENIESQFGFPFIDVPFPGLRAISIALHDQRIIAAMNHVISPDDQTTLFARLSSDGEVIPFRQEQTAAVFSPGPEWGEYHVADAVMTGNGKLVLTGATDSPELNG